MGRKLPEPTPCDTMARFSAPVHGTMSAYNRHRCRCTAAIKARYDWRATWRASEAGQLYAKRYNERRRAAYRDDRGLTAWELDTLERRARAGALLRAGHSQPDVARRVGVHVRTVQRWVATWRA